MIAIRCVGAVRFLTTPTWCKAHQLVTVRSRRSVREQAWAEGVNFNQILLINSGELPFIVTDIICNIRPKNRGPGLSVAGQVLVQSLQIVSKGCDFNIG